MPTLQNILLINNPVPYLYVNIYNSGAHQPLLLIFCKFSYTIFANYKFCKTSCRLDSLQSVLWLRFYLPNLKTTFTEVHVLRTGCYLKLSWWLTDQQERYYFLFLILHFTLSELYGILHGPTQTLLSRPEQNQYLRLRAICQSHILSVINGRFKENNTKRFPIKPRIK